MVVCSFISDETVDSQALICEKNIHSITTENDNGVSETESQETVRHSSMPIPMDDNCTDLLK